MFSAMLSRCYRSPTDFAQEFRYYIRYKNLHTEFNLNHIHTPEFLFNI